MLTPDAYPRRLPPALTNDALWKSTHGGEEARQRKVARTDSHARPQPRRLIRRSGGVQRLNPTDLDCSTAGQSAFSPCSETGETIVLICNWTFYC